MADYDIIVIGGGPGGYTAAIRASQLGLKAAVVEREHLGGICSNWGCIPTKAMLRSAEILTHIRDADAFGLDLSGTVTPNVEAIVKRSRGIAERMNGGVAMLLKKNKVDVIWGQAKLTSPGTVEVGAPDKAACEPQPPAPKQTKPHGTYTAAHVIISTGARPRVLPGLEPDGDRVWTYFEALKPAEIPESLAIVGSGAIGIEFASFYAAMGTDVTVVEMVDRILPAEDDEVSAFMRTALEKRGIAFRTGTKINGANVGKDGVTLTLDGGDTIEVERVISAAGVVANTEGLGLEDLGITVERGLIATTGAGRTSVAGVYAIGDVTGAPMLAHKAEHEGALCVEAIAGDAVHPLNKDRIPACTYCDPQVASIGPTEAQAKADGRNLKVGKFPFLANGKAITLGEAQGMAKVIFDADTGELLGAHLVGPEVTELIHGFATAMELESTEAEIFDTIYPHPTISEVLKEAAMAAFGRAVNV
ncbi:dihydrolipoyl dehydrogenase [Palleronia abyssalis]|uniref:Dihydrolipoyl dehydrogenase n=1 Tax=Palleronia abyssalis TaxID=1501240 RepID=A0A2R8C0V9_9RHOB|nr:dihydrolipoyl dehydrogenase [Palleronia abyssalis]SPJ26044.1 Dihydrolipoyl dehydrogenase [Palleronia abyssalis]